MGHEFMNTTHMQLATFELRSLSGIGVGYVRKCRPT